MQDSAAIKNVPSLNGYYRKVSFGFASARLELTPERFAECADRKNFRAAELPSEYLAGLPVNELENLRKRYPVLHCGNLLTPSLATLILDAGRNMQREFVRTCAGIFRRMADLKLPAAALDFSLQQTLRDAGRRKILSGLLRELHPALHETGVTLLLPVRLPLPDPAWKETVTGFLRGTMIPRLKLRLEIYPHELKQDFSPEDLAGTFRLETGSVLFCCNADCGNRLLRQHLTPWMRYYALTGFPGPFLFCPFSQENRLAAAESESYSRLVEELSNVHPRKP
ncbi:MAG: hypothetical protein IJS14_11705 [Lentisphaeria bacterium]|nr:hypothetical protein [Lentisphaeria bacterium]